MYDISVCICTYKRPSMLWHTLMSIAEQNTSYKYEIVVVDNDINKSGMKTCERARRELFNYNLQYSVEPNQNISLARNKAIKRAKSELIALIDDDETATDKWIDAYIEVLSNSDYDYAVGPVLLVIPNEWPNWLIKGGIFHEKIYQTQKNIRACTNNACYKRHCFSQRSEPFDHRYGRTGGEDAEFGSFLAQRKFHGVWCQNATVYEIQEDSRRKPMWHIKRAFQHGLNHSAFLTHKNGRRKAVFQNSTRSICGIIRAILCYGITFYNGRTGLFKLLVSLSRQVGRISYFFGVRKRGY